MSSHADISTNASRTPGELAGPDGITVEYVSGAAMARQVETLQMDIWNGNEAWVVPSHALLIVADYGGIVLGARMDDSLVGFVLGFLARADGKLFHASHMLGVLPTCQHHGIGAALKWRQREVAREQGLDLMRWTFDPLEARNAHFNLHKLGTVCRVYRPDFYGPLHDELNRDLPSDRLLVEWCLTASDREPINVATPQTILHNSKGHPELRTDGMADNAPVAIEIPRDFQSVKRESPDFALLWRLAVREAFSASFGRGYRACDFRDGAYILLPQGREA